MARTLALLPLLLLACSTPQPLGHQPERELVTPRPRIDGGASQLAKVPPPAVAAESLRRRCGALAAAGRRASLSVIVTRHADVALEALRAAPARIDPATRALAEAYARAVGGRWSIALGAPEAERQRYLDARQQRIVALGAGRFVEAMEVRVTPPPGELTADACRLEALAALAAGKPAEADQAIVAALAASGDPLARAQLLSLRSLALRRLGKPGEADDAWRAAARAAGALAARKLPLPRLWERLAQQRPVRQGWPKEALAGARASLGELSAAFLPGAGASASVATVIDRAALRTAIGRWRLGRGEAGPALLAFKQAQAMLPEASALRAGPLAEQRLRLEQARALAQLGQRGPAHALLIDLEREPATQRSALGLLGAMALAAGDLGRARATLRKALSGGSSDWPGRRQAVADATLTALLAGEPEAHRALLAAADALGRSGDLDGQLSCLINGLTITRERGQTAEAAQLAEALKTIESS